jgi:hypothetical protein
VLFHFFATNIVCLFLHVAFHEKNVIQNFSIHSGVSSSLNTQRLFLTSSSAFFTDVHFHDFATSISAFDGTHQKFVQSHHIIHASTSATFFHAPASHIAAVSHQLQAHITIISNIFFIFF